MPAFQFYPADWRKDPGVQALSRHDRSVWFDMLCIMHESDERGVLLLAGRPVPEDALARMLNLDNQTFNQTLTNILTYGVASRRQSDGAIYSRRMVKDENLCQLRREAGKKGGNPGLVNQKSKQKPTTGVNQKPTPSSSTSSSSSSNDERLAGGQAGEGSASQVESPPAAGTVGGPARAVLAEDAEVFTKNGFREFVKSIGFGGIDIGHYLVQIQQAASREEKPRANSGKGLTWEGFVKHYLNNDRLHNRLVAPVPADGQLGAQPQQRYGPTPTATVATGSYDRQAIAARQSTQIVT